jgi:hypothetical protein
MKKLSLISVFLTTDKEQQEDTGKEYFAQGNKVYRKNSDWPGSMPARKKRCYWRYRMDGISLSYR